MEIYPINNIQRAACAGIVSGSGYSCTDPLKAGVNETLYIGNLDDIGSVTYDPAIPDQKVITGITMKAGTSMFAFVGVRSSNKPDISLQADDFSVGFIHQIDFSVFEVDSAQKVNLQGMAAKKTFCIYQNPNDSSLGDAIFEVMGVNSGLEMSTLNRQPASKDGSYKIQLRTPEASSETALPNSFFDTDYTTTSGKIEALVSGANMALVSATVETGTPTEIVLTYDKTVTSFGAFTVGGDTVKSVISIAAATVVVTVTVDAAYLAGDTITVSGTASAADGTLTLSNQVVTNNVV